jgi:Transposase DDE domain group 1
VLRDQAQLFGPVASDPTAWRLLSNLDSRLLDRLAQARAAARNGVGATHRDPRRPAPDQRGRGVCAGLVLDMDASIVICHSDKESATPTWKHSFGYHPLFCFLDNTREALSGMLREGRAGSNTTADHITVLDQALTQIPDNHRHGTPILIRSDSAGCTFGLLAHIRGLRALGVDARFSVGVAITEPIRQAILTAKAHGTWAPALDSDGEPRDGAEVCELTGLVPDDGYPPGTRFIVRRERPHPGAQLSLFDTIEGLRHQVMATDTPADTPPTGRSIPRSPPPRPRPCRRPHPHRQGHRLRPVPVPGLRHQPSLAATRPDRHRPARLDPTSAPARRPRHRRTEEAALPIAARRRPDRPHRPHDPAPHRRTVAMGLRPRYRVPATRRPASTRRLTPPPRPDEQHLRNPADAPAHQHAQTENAHPTKINRAPTTLINT